MCRRILLSVLTLAFLNGLLLLESKAQPVAESFESSGVLSYRTQALENDLLSLRDEVARLRDNFHDVQRLEDKVSWIERELTNSLMNISNFLDVANANMDSAHAAIEASQAAISASEAYLSTGSYVSALLGIIAAVAAIGAAIWIQRSSKNISDMSSSVAQEIKAELTASWTNTPSHGTRQILRAVTESVKKDLEETPALLMKSEEFREMLDRLITAAVVSKDQELRVEASVDPLSPEQFTNAGK